MPRQPLDQNDRTERVTLRLTETDLDRLDQVATSTGLSRSEALRRALDEYTDCRAS